MNINAPTTSEAANKMGKKNKQKQEEVLILIKLKFYVLFKKNFNINKYNFIEFPSLEYLWNL